MKHTSKYYKKIKMKRKSKNENIKDKALKELYSKKLDEIYDLYNKILATIKQYDEEYHTDIESEYWGIIVNLITFFEGGEIYDTSNECREKCRYDDYKDDYNIVLDAYNKVGKVINTKTICKLCDIINKEFNCE